MVDRRLSNMRKNQAAFLDEFRQGGTVTHAAEVIGITRGTVYDWRKADLDFEAAFIEAEAQNTENLEQLAIDMARPHEVEVEEQEILRDRRGNALLDDDGNPRMVTTRRSKKIQYDTTLLIFLLKGRLPMKYRERFDMNHSGEVGIRLLDIDDALARLDTTIIDVPALPDAEPGED